MISLLSWTVRLWHLSIGNKSFRHLCFWDRSDLNTSTCIGLIDMSCEHVQLVVSLDIVDF